MPDLMDPTLTTKEVRVYFTLDDATTIGGDLPAVPAGWVELDENSNWELEGTGPTADAMTRGTRGHARDVVTHTTHSLTFAFKPQRGTDPIVTRKIDVGTVMRLLKVGDDGFYVSVLAQVTRVREAAGLNAIPGWEGTATVQEHPVRGRITTWPPTPVPPP